jgi:hypothetical protein
MVWGLFLMIYGEQVREGFNSHMIATYETVRECNEAARDLSNKYVNRSEYSYTFKSPRYRCAPIPKQ